MNPEILAILTEIASASDVTALNALRKKYEKEITENPVLLMTINGSLAAHAYKGGLNTDKLAERAEKNEIEIKADAENILSRFEKRREAFRIAELLAAIYRDMFPGRSGAIQVSVSTGAVAEMETEMPERVKTAANTMGKSVKGIKHSKSVDVKFAKSRKADEKAEVSPS